MAPQMNSIKHVQKKLYQSYKNSFRKLRVREYFSTCFIKLTNPDTKPDKNITREENERPISLMNRDVKFLTKYEQIESSNMNNE